MNKPVFTIRVYGLLIHRGAILLVDEDIRGRFVTKFPGGGLEYGEGTRECLKREILEETGLLAEVGEHFYTTDFFQQSAFHDRPLQVMSIYYRVNLPEYSEKVQLQMPVGDEFIRGFRWVPVSELSQEHLSLPIDRVVVDLLMKELSQ